MGYKGRKSHSCDLEIGQRLCIERLPPNVYTYTLTRRSLLPKLQDVHFYLAHPAESGLPGDGSCKLSEVMKPNANPRNNC